MADMFPLNITSLRWALVVIFFLPLSCALSKTPESIAHQLSDLIVKIKVASSVDASKSAYGSGFPVDKDGLIATNFHVIAPALTKDKKLQIFVEWKGMNLPANVVAFDALFDLALIKVDHFFSQLIPIISSRPKQGERIFSLGFPLDLPVTMIEGTFNGIVEKGIYSEFHLSTGLNPGMSGGPTVNSTGEVVGVNVSTILNAQNISFAISAAKLIQLLSSVNPDNTETLSFPQIQKFFTSQVLLGQERLGQDIHKHSDTQNATPMNDKLENFTLPKLPDYLKCWESASEDKANRPFKSSQKMCSLSGGTYWQSDLPFATYEVQINWYQNKKLSGAQFYSLIQEKLSPPKDITGFFSGHELHPQLSEASCNHAYVVNRFQIPVKVNYCLQSYTDFPLLYRFIFDILTLTKTKEEIVYSGNFQGFSQEQLHQLIDYFIQNIKRD